MEEDPDMIDWLAVCALVQTGEFVTAVQNPHGYLYDNFGGIQPHRINDQDFFNEVELVKPELLATFFKLYVICQERRLKLMESGLDPASDEVASLMPAVRWRYIERIPSILELDPDILLENVTIRIAIIKQRISRRRLARLSRNSVTYW